jgi:hypothetical protein
MGTTLEVIGTTAIRETTYQSIWRNIGKKDETFMDENLYFYSQ